MSQTYGWYLLLGVCCLGGLVLPRATRNLSSTDIFHVRRHQRHLQHTAYPDGSVVPVESCQVPAVPVHTKSIPATFASSYPGSGAKLTWRLIRAVTGLYTGDDYDHNGKLKEGRAVAIKTHFPSHTNKIQSPELDRIQQAILLTRNPLAAIPSFHNYLYERANGLMNHSTRAPITAWIEWRNRYFEQEVDKWVDHIRWWVQNFRPLDHTEKLLLLPYERLISPDTGPAALEKLGTYLGNVHPDIQQSLVSQPMYACIWDIVVQRRTIPGESQVRMSHREGGPTGGYPYTDAQLEYAMQRLIALRDEYRESFQELYQLLQEYLVVIEEKRKVQAS